MKTFTDKTNKPKNPFSLHQEFRDQVRNPSFTTFEDHRPEISSHKQLQDIANNSPQHDHAIQLQAMADNHTQGHEGLVSNKTNLPKQLKSGLERLSGFSMDDIKVHYNSNKPAQLHALAYTQGTDIYVGPGQEKHLPHEAWHVVQQKQDRVKPTAQLKGKLNINNDNDLEKEADIMGMKASQSQEVYANQTQDSYSQNNSYPVIQKIVDRKAIERSARQLMLKWFRKTPQKYDAVGTEYEALLDGIDNYHQIMDSTIVRAFNNDGVRNFKETAIAQISAIRRLCMDLTLEDDDGDLNEVVINFVLRSLNKEESIITGISDQFSTGILYGKDSGWNGQFAGNTFKRAIEIAEFALPLYEANYSEERAFIRSPQGMPRELRFETSGYKLHISINEMSMEQARDIILPVLQREDYQHKIVADHSKMQDGQAGKIITIYPKTMDEVKQPDGFRDLVALLEEVISHSGIIAGAPVPNEIQVDHHGYIFLEENARYR